MSVQTLPLVRGSESHPVRFFLLWFGALFALLALVNCVVVPGDAGWFAANPTPFLLIPVLLGVRYGFGAGFGAGVFTVLLLVAGRSMVGQGLSLSEHRYTLIAFPLLGVILGQVSASMRRRGSGLEEESEQLRRANRQGRAERELLLLSRQDLQQRLELHGVETDSLDEKVGKDLMATDCEFSASALLGTLARVNHVGSAALYEVPPGSRSAALVRVASLGGCEHFPEYLLRDDHQIVAEALARNCFLVQKTLLQSPPSQRPGHLAAYPIKDVDRTTTHVLIVRELPCSHIKPGTFDEMKSICDRRGASPGGSLHDEARLRSISQSQFYAAMEAAVTTHTKYAVPSILVRVPFDFSEGVDPAESFHDLLEVLPPKTLLSNSYEDGRRSLLFLLPANSDPVLRDALRDLFFDFVGELGLGREHAPHFVMTAPGHSPQQLWGKLVVVGQDVSFR